MASVDFLKIKTRAHLYNLLRHCSEAERLEDEHRNKHIDKTMTARNEELWGYSEAAGRFRARVDELDATTNTNHRYDRVEAFGLEVPVPPGIAAMEPYMQADWLSDAYEVIVGRVGMDNVIGAYTHEDEVHDYRDSRTASMEESRRHLHVYVVPEIDGVINGRKFSSKASMKAMNKAIEKMSLERYGVPFMTGKAAAGGVPYGKSVEELKVESEAVQEIMDEHSGLMARERRTARHKVSDAEQAAREIREQAEQDAREMREQAAQDVLAMREERDRAQVARDAARRDALEYADEARQLKQAREGLQTALQGDLRAVEVQEARQGATALLGALGATVRPLFALDADSKKAVRDGISSAMAQMKQMNRQNEARWATSGPSTVDGPTV